jgi:hypothetical protein
VPYETDESSPKKRLARPIKIAFVLITILFFAILVGYSKIYTNSKNDLTRDRERLSEIQKLTQENAQRIVEIQGSRTYSCKQTYRGIRKVVFQLYPPQPARTDAQQESLEKFSITIDKFIDGCTKQTKPKNSKKKGNS